MDLTSLPPRARRAYDASFVLGVLALPALTLYVVTAILHYDGRLVIPDGAFLSRLRGPSLPMLGRFLLWLMVQVALMRLLPGRTVLGVELDDGKRLPYKLNGLAAEAITFVFAAALVLGLGVSPTFFFDQIEALLSTANVVVILLCALLYVLGRAQATAAERKRNFIEAYFLGATLNPRTGDFDWKFFSESRPGMILWILADASAAAAQRAHFGYVSPGMWLVCAFQLLYVTDYFVFEDAILSTWDIRHEPFGFMLGWGCLVWIPFMFSLQAVYLANHPDARSTVTLVGIALLNFAGYFIFRFSNLQKHRFRSDPERSIWGRPPEFIETQRGTRLLVSGFWGWARHMNYTGDLMMGLAWCLCTDARTLLPYFYFIYFVILLVHRERRDNAHCALKYAEDWVRYQRRVPRRMIPFLY